MEITKDKVTELFCIIDEFYKVLSKENNYNMRYEVLPDKNKYYHLSFQQQQ